MHMNIATGLLQGIKDRQLDTLFQMEESITKQTKANILEAINDPEKKVPEDKMRLFLIYYLSIQEDISSETMQEYEDALVKAGCDLAPLRYVKGIRAFTRMTTMNQQPPQTFGRPDYLLNRLGTIGNKVQRGICGWIEWAYQRHCFFCHLTWFCFVPFLFPYNKNLSYPPAFGSPRIRRFGWRI